jgi:hypothetical protein
MMHTTSGRRRTASVVLAVALFSTLSSCDVVDPGVFSLDDEHVKLTYQFSGGAAAGTPLTPLANKVLDLRAAVIRQSFSTTDVVSARIKSGSARIEIFGPAGESLGAFSSAEVRAGGANGVLLLSGSDFSNALEAALTIRANDIRSLVVSDPLPVQLSLVTARQLVNQPYSIDVSFVVQIQVQG